MVGILFVCTGNICRSAMAHHYMQKRVKDLGIQDKYLIDSCGICAYTGDISTQNAVNAMKKYDVDLTYHRAKNISTLNLEDYKYIVTMTQAHKNNILYMYPNFKDKVYTLKELANNNGGDIDISDPWGFDFNTYVVCAKQIVDLVDILIQKLEKGMI